MMAAWLLAALVSGAEIVSEVMRPPMPDGLSGLTHVGEADYLAIDDSDGRMVTLKIPVDRVSGEIGKPLVTNEVLLAGLVDGEGLAWDPLRKTVWVAEEKGCHIAEYDAKTGKVLSRVAMPAHFARARLDLGIESLTLSPDGRTMWTATEEAVEGDGDKATRTSGTTVRLQRFSRKAKTDEWKPSGQFAYAVDPMGGGPFRKNARSGLSDLCVLPGGELVALEREFSVKGFLPTFRMRLYRVDLKGATDVSGFDRLEGAKFTPTGKTLLLDADTGFSMYEGVCVGPKLVDGTQMLLLVSDGDGEAVETLLSVRLSY